MARMALEISRFQGWVQVKELVAYLNELQASVGGAELICQALLEAAGQDLISADVFSIFIPWSKSPAVVAKCLDYEHNVSIRRIAIKEFGKHLRRPGKFDWETTWGALGDSEGLVQIFGRSSVDEVKTLSTFIGGCNRGHENHKREQRVEELLRALLPAVYTSISNMQSKDSRPIQHYYAIMLSACSKGFVNGVLDSRDSGNPLYKWRDLTRLVRSHRALMKERAITHLFGRGPEDDDVPRYLDTFLYSDRDFAIKALQGRLDGTVTDERWGHNDEVAVLMPIVHRLARSWRAPSEVKRHIHDLIKLGLNILGKVRSKDTRKSRPLGLWNTTFSRWQIWPDQYEDVLRLGMRLGLAEIPHKAPRTYLPVLRRLDSELGRRLLEICYLDIPEHPLALFSAEDFSTVAKQPWPLDLFRVMSTDQAIWVLTKLYQVNPEYSFLQTSGNSSILSEGHNGSQHNLNVDLYLTFLQRGDHNVQRRSRDTTDRLRKKASTTRDQSDRAALAKTAACYAIATGDLNLYGETVVWQQRFIRDPLTVRVVFGRNVVRTDEGIELLSGVPAPESLPSASKGSIELLKEMSLNITSADAILRTFQESYLLATREPSFQEYDWTYVKDLFTEVFKSRISRSETLQRKRPTPESDIFQVVWKCLLAALEWLDTQFINLIRAPVQELLEKSQPGFLAVATRSLLDIWTERRKRRQNEGASHQTSTKSTSRGMPAPSPSPGFPVRRTNQAAGDETLEQISYHALVKLANSDMPSLASPLILQTVLERPDASSWHRILLSLGFLKRLRAEEAHRLLLNLARGVGEKLEEQSYVRVGESEPPRHAPSKPAVKVTTVKYLAQLLNKATFISNDTAAEVLIELFKSAQHQDIRLAALESLLSLLDSICIRAHGDTNAHPTVRKIMISLKTVVPVVGSINERRPLREEDWTEAETTGILPELSECSASHLPPLMDAVVNVVHDSGRTGLKKLENEFFEHIIRPVLERSQQEHTRWINMFLAKHEATALKPDIPETPLTPLLWNTVFCSCHLSVHRKYLADFNSYAIIRIAPTHAMVKFSAYLRAHSQLREDPEVQHWLEIFDRPISIYQTETARLIALIDSLNAQPVEPLRDDLLDMYFQHATLYLEQYEKYTEMWEYLVNQLSPTRRTMEGQEYYTRWQHDYRFLIIRLLDLVKNKRRQEQRPILPSTARLELFLVFTLRWYATDESCESFVTSMEELLLAMLGEDDACALVRWPDIARVACDVIPAIIDTDEERLRVAYHIGSIGHADEVSDGTSRQLRVASDLIKLEVALELIGRCKKAKDSDLLVRRLKEWRACDSDAIREKVFQWENTR